MEYFTARFTAGCDPDADDSSSPQHICNTSNRCSARPHQEHSLGTEQKRLLNSIVVQLLIGLPLSSTMKSSDLTENSTPQGQDVLL